MKRFLSIGMVFLVLCGCFNAYAETFQEKATSLMDLINQQLYYYEVVNHEFLFTGIYEVSPEEGYIFFSEVTDMQAYITADTASGEIKACDFSTAVPDNLLLALNCCSYIPLLSFNEADNDDDGWAAIDENVYAAYEKMLNWGDAVYVNALTAFYNNSEYDSPILETDYFSIGITIKPEKDYSVATVTYTFSVGKETPAADAGTIPSTDASPAIIDKVSYILESINASALYYGVTNCDPLFSDLLAGDTSDSYLSNSSGTDISVNLTTDSETGEITSCTFTTSTPNNLLLALNCCYYTPPLIMGIPNESEGWIDLTEAENEALEILTDWGGVMMMDALKSLIAKEAFEAPSLETDYFLAELAVIPTDNSTAAKISLYFNTDAAFS